MSSYFHSASQSCSILSANCRYDLRLFPLLRGDSSCMDKYSSAKCLLYSDIVILWYSYRKRTKKPWRKRQSGSWRFSFHKYFTTFFYLFLFFNYFTLFYFCAVNLLKVGRVFASSTRYAVLNALITTCHGNLQIDITRNGEGQSGQESEEKAERKWLANGSSG